MNKGDSYQVASVSAAIMNTMCETAGRSFKVEERTWTRVNINIID